MTPSIYENSSHILTQMFDTRREQYDSAEELLELLAPDPTNAVFGCKQLGLWAPLKSGKNDTIRILALKLRAKNIESYYTVSLPRNDMKPQFEESSKYGITVLPASEFAIKNFDPKKLYVVFYDEADYGEGANQVFHKRFVPYKSLDNVASIAISATNFTAQANNLPMVYSKVSPTYIGLASLHYHQVSDTKPFDKAGTPSTELHDALNQWLNHSDKTTSVVRATSFHLDNTFKVQRYIRDHFKQHVEVILVNKDLPFNERNGGWCPDPAFWTEAKRLIIVIQTFTRGTETNIQPFCHFYFHNSNDKTKVNTIIQAFGRFCNYRNATDIHIYTSEAGIRAKDNQLQIEQTRSMAGLQAGKGGVSHLSNKLSLTVPQTKNGAVYHYDWNNVKLLKNKPKDGFNLGLHSRKNDERIFSGLQHNTNPDGRTRKPTVWVNIHPSQLEPSHQAFFRAQGILTHLQNGFIVRVEGKLQTSPPPSAPSRATIHKLAPTIYGPGINTKP